MLKLISRMVLPESRRAQQGQCGPDREPNFAPLMIFPVLGIQLEGRMADLTRDHELGLEAGTRHECLL
jgi:hypothetical protein